MNLGLRKYLPILAIFGAVFLFGMHGKAAKDSNNDNQLRKLAKAADLFNSAPVISNGADMTVGRLNGRKSVQRKSEILREGKSVKIASLSFEAPKRSESETQIAKSKRQTDKLKTTRAAIGKKKVSKRASAKKKRAPKTTTKASASSKRVKNLGLACKKGDSESCYRLGMLAIHKRKNKMAMRLYRRACDLGELLACRTLSTTLSKSGRSRIAAHFDRKACLLGDLNSCTTYKKQ